MEASTRDRLRPAQGLARTVLLPPLFAGVALLCLMLAIALSFGQRDAKSDNPLALQQDTPDEIAQQLTVDLEGTPTPADIRRAQKPLTERRRLLHAHPYFSIYKIAKQRFDVSWYLVAAIHYQETGFGEAPKTLASTDNWRRHKNAAEGIIRPTSYPNRTERHPSVKDDFDVVMAIAANLKASGAKTLTADTAERALRARYGTGPAGRLATAMVLERARAWRLIGTLPLPGRGELATPVRGVVGGCGYFGCPRPGRLHNGVDLLAPTGTPIRAADDGVVASVESPGQSGGYGNFVCVQHRPHLASCYAHMSAFAAAIRPGARVKRGQIIGRVGSTGQSSAPHLHFEVRRGSAACSTCAVDPMPMLSADVPDTALPKIVGSAPAGTRAPSSSATVPITPPPASAAPSTQANNGRSAPRGAVPGAKPPIRTPAPAPASQQPAPAPAVQQPAPPPTGDPGATGGAVPDVSSPASAPAPPPPPPEATAPPG